MVTILGIKVLSSLLIKKVIVKNLPLIILKVDKLSDDNAKGRGDRHFKL